MTKWTALSPFLALEMWSDHQNSSKMASKKQPQMRRIGSNEAVRRRDTIVYSIAGTPIVADAHRNTSTHVF